MDTRLKLRLYLWAREVAMTIAGLTMAVIPLAIWASPTLSVFYSVLTACAVSCAVVLLLSEFGPDETTPASGKSNRVALAPDLVHMLQNQRELGREDLPELRRFVTDKSKSNETKDRN